MAEKIEAHVHWNGEGWLTYLTKQAGKTCEFLDHRTCEAVSAALNAAAAAAENSAAALAVAAVHAEVKEAARVAGVQSEQDEKNEAGRRLHEAVRQANIVMHAAKENTSTEAAKRLVELDAQYKYLQGLISKALENNLKNAEDNNAQAIAKANNVDWLSQVKAENAAAILDQSKEPAQAESPDAPSVQSATPETAPDLPPAAASSPSPEDAAPGDTPQA